MAKKRKAAKKSSRRKKSKSIADRIMDAITPSRRNSRGGNVTRRQGV
jgi:hypothetical protein